MPCIYPPTIASASTVARFLVAVQRQAPPATRYWMPTSTRNRQPPHDEHGVFTFVLTLAVAAGRVRGVYVVADATKLRYLASLEP